MPELPEVETTRREVVSRLAAREVEAVVVRHRRLRWPIPARIREMAGAPIERVRRRGKYLLFDTPRGSALVHLGMSGSLCWVDRAAPWRTHEHVEWRFATGPSLRYHDPRRFGAVLWTRNGDRHPLLSSLGPEPFDPVCDAAYLHARSRGRRISVRDFLLDGRVIAGVGNIYANESAFRAGVHPGRAAGRVSRARWERLVDELRLVLENAISGGGTTLRDFVAGSGEAGRYGSRLLVYGREGEACPRCAGVVRRRARNGRSYY